MAVVVCAAQALCFPSLLSLFLFSLSLFFLSLRCPVWRSASPVAPAPSGAQLAPPLGGRPQHSGPFSELRALAMALATGNSNRPWHSAMVPATGSGNMQWQFGNGTRPWQWHQGMPWQQTMAKALATFTGNGNRQWQSMPSGPQVLKTNVGGDSQSLPPRHCHVSATPAQRPRLCGEGPLCTRNTKGGGEAGGGVKGGVSGSKGLQDSGVGSKRLLGMIPKRVLGIPQDLPGCSPESSQLV